MEKQKPQIRILALMLAVLFSAAIFAGCGNGTESGAGGASDQGSSAEAGSTGAKAITLTVTHKDGSTKEFNLETTEENLGAALLAEKIISGNDGEYGLFVTTVDGETADEGNQEWWCLTIGGETATTGVDSTPIEDGGAYELTLTVGY